MVHKIFFNRDVKDYLIQLVNLFITKGTTIRKTRGTTIISLLDTYSLGVVFPNILCKLAKQYNKLKELKELLKMNIIKSYVDLLKHMCEPSNKDRMNPIDVYDKYIELEKLYIKKDSNCESCKKCSSFSSQSFRHNFDKSHIREKRFNDKKKKKTM